MGANGMDVDVTGTPFEHWTDEQWMQFGIESQNWTLSQFLHGEQGALMCTGPHRRDRAVDRRQVLRRHPGDGRGPPRRGVRPVPRREALGPYPINAHLRMLLDDIIADNRWDITYLGMQIMVEGLALAAFGFMHETTTEPLLKQLLRYVMSDEARHVAFGVLSLQEFYAGLRRAEITERQEFAFEAAVRMRDRFLQQEVWERLGVPVAEAVSVLRPTPIGSCSSACCSPRSSPTARSSACSTPVTVAARTGSPSWGSSSSKTLADTGEEFEAFQLAEGGLNGRASRCRTGRLRSCHGRRFGAVGCAMVTPFARRRSSTLTARSTWPAGCPSHGNDFLVVAGTTGESPVLSETEKVVAVGGRGRRVTSVVAGTSTTDTAHSVELTRRPVPVGAAGSWR